MKKALTLVCMLASFSANAKNFYIDEKLSSLSFTTITFKNQFVIETANIPSIEGSLKKNKFDLKIDFRKLETGVQSRDERINQLYLTKLFPSISVQGDFNLDTVSRIERADIPATITLYGNSREMMLPVIIQKGVGYFSVNSTKPILIKGSDFGIPSANLNALVATIGGIKIADTIPVNFNVVFVEG